MKPIRPLLVWLHRWVGLAMALFLLIEGLTGSILAFEGPIGRGLDPPAARTPGEQGLPTLDFATLAEVAESLEPLYEVAYFQVAGPDVAVLRVVPREEPNGGAMEAAPITDVVLDAHTGRDLGRIPGNALRKDLAAQVLPFIKELHYNLALGDPATWALFFVALAWTIDCFVSLALTLPARRARFWMRWLPAWKLRLGAGTYRLNFDLHRAAGLWLLLALLAFAWSSVELEDKWQTYDTVMAMLTDYRKPLEDYGSWPRHDATPLRLDWRAAQQQGRELMDEVARRKGFRILRPTSLVKFPTNGLYNYEVQTDRSFPDPVQEVVFFDGDTGREVHLPGMESAHSGNIVSDWLRALHMAVDPVDYFAYRVFICAFGLVLALISVTGVVIWWKKRAGRLHHLRIARAAGRRPDADADATIRGRG